MWASVFVLVDTVVESTSGVGGFFDTSCVFVKHFSVDDPIVRGTLFGTVGGGDIGDTAAMDATVVVDIFGSRFHCCRLYKSEASYVGDEKFLIAVARLNAASLHCTSVAIFFKGFSEVVR